MKNGFIVGLNLIFIIGIMFFSCNQDEVNPSFRLYNMGDVTVDHCYIGTSKHFYSILPNTKTNYYEIAPEGYKIIAKFNNGSSTNDDELDATFDAFQRYTVRLYNDQITVINDYTNESQ